MFIIPRHHNDSGGYDLIDPDTSRISRSFIWQVMELNHQQIPDILATWKRIILVILRPYLE